MAMLNNQMVSIVHSPCSTHQLIIFISLSSRAALASPACSRTTPRCFQARPWERGGAWRSLILGCNLMKLGSSWANHSWDRQIKWFSYQIIMGNHLGKFFMIFIATKIGKGDETVSVWDFDRSPELKPLPEMSRGQWQWMQQLRCSCLVAAWDCVPQVFSC